MSNVHGPIDFKTSVVKQQLRLTLPDYVISFCLFIRFFSFFLLCIKHLCIFVPLTAILICFLST